MFTLTTPSRLADPKTLTYSGVMAKKSTQKTAVVFTKRSYEPLKMTVAIAAAAATLLVLLALLVNVR